MKTNWLNIVKFHKEIIKRSEIDFFSLPISRNFSGNERFSYLNSFDLQSLAGQRILRKEEVKTSNFFNPGSGIFVTGDSGILVDFEETK